MKMQFVELLNHVKTWGINSVRAPSTKLEETTLEIYRQTTDESSLVGRLWCEDGEFVFRYDSGYRGKPISAFPDIEHEYRSVRLWPFFAVRIPPLDREDMRREIKNRSLRDDRVIEILGSVARVSVTNPYEFKLAGG